MSAGKDGAFEERLRDDHNKQSAASAAPRPAKSEREDKDDEGRPVGELEMTAEDVAKRRSAQLDAMNKQFLVVGPKYFYKDNARRMAFEDKGGRIVTADKDSRIGEAMARMAEAKGWTSIKVSGHPDFQREVWLQASAIGLKVNGYTPKDADLAALESLRASKARNSVERSPERSNSKEQKQPAEPTAEKIEQVRKKKQQDEDYNQLRPEGRERISKQRIIEKVSADVAELKIKNPATREKVAGQVKAQLDRMNAKGDDVPTIHTYDRHAPAKAREVDKARGQVDRNVERTR